MRITVGYSSLLCPAPRLATRRNTCKRRGRTIFTFANNVTATATCVRDKDGTTLRPAHLSTSTTPAIAEKTTSCGIIYHVLTTGSTATFRNRVHTTIGSLTAQEGRLSTAPVATASTVAGLATSQQPRTT